MPRDVVIVALLVLLEVNRSYGYVIHRDRQGNEESMIEEKLERVFENRRKIHIPLVLHAPTYDKSAVSGEHQRINDPDIQKFRRKQGNNGEKEEKNGRGGCTPHKIVVNETIANYLTSRGFVNKKQKDKKQKDKKLHDNNHPASNNPQDNNQPDNNQQDNNNINSEKYRKAIREYAIFHGLKKHDNKICENIDRVIKLIEIFIMKESKKRRCGDPDVDEGDFDAETESNPTLKRKKRYLTESQWGRNDLTYKIHNFSTKGLTEEDQKAQFAIAFGKWADATPGLEISEAGPTEKADIDIKFASGDHGDGEAFDGPGSVVAHTFYPEDGRMHFDNDEVFTMGSEDNKVNLLSTAMHEIGHALGLAHSSNPTSIMHPDYDTFSTNQDLSEDDVNGIQFLYPSNETPQGGCVDQFWCADILDDECEIFGSYCKVKCKVCT